jgi:hypothetical protein
LNPTWVAANSIEILSSVGCSVILPPPARRDSRYLDFSWFERYGRELRFSARTFKPRLLSRPFWSCV